MILAGHFGGFSEVDRLDPLTVRLALQHLSEERVGSSIRRERAIEEAEAKKSAAALGRSGERPNVRRDSGPSGTP